MTPRRTRCARVSRAHASIVLGVLASALVLAGCGDDTGAAGSNSSGDSTTTTTAPATSTTTTTAAPATSTTVPSADAPPVPVFWTLDPAFPISDTDSSVHVLLRPMECVGDVDREPMPAEVEVVDDEIHITAFVRAVEEPTGARVCSERTFPTVVDLGTPIDGRALVDSSCLVGGSRAGSNPHEWCVQHP